MEQSDRKVYPRAHRNACPSGGWTSSNKVWDLEICKNIFLLKEASGIILYGAAEKGKEIVKSLQDAKIKVEAFCDMDMKKWGETIDNIKIISPFDLKNNINKTNNTTYIIACILNPQELCDLLEYMELNTMRIITYWGIKTALQINAEIIYGIDSKYYSHMQIENRLRKNQYINLGLDIARNLITTPDSAIWLIQPGKTASTSLASRLKRKDIPIISMHYLEYPDHIIGEQYREVWEKIIQKKSSAKIITMVREPLNRDYSAFWQAFTEDVRHIMWMPILGNDFQMMYEKFIDFILKGSTYTKKILGDSMPYTWNDEFEWFDEQIKKHLGIDVYQYPFDREKGYTIIKKENVELFLYKVEKMEEIMDKISEFAGVPNLPAVNANVAKQKWYGLAYAQFRKEVLLPERYVKHYYEENSKMDYFYTGEEKSSFLKEWKNNIENGDK